MGGRLSDHGLSCCPAAEATDRELDAIFQKARAGQAVTLLEAEQPRKAQLVKLRYFAGMTLEDAAEALDISLATAKRDWTSARVWLYRRLEGRPPDS